MTLSDPLQASLLRLSAKGISVFSPHTSLDATPNGINTFLIQPFTALAKDGTSEVLGPPGEKVAGFEGAGMGRRVDLGKSLEVTEVVKMVKEHLSLDHGEPSSISLRSELMSSNGCCTRGSTAD
jgi:putative NIF3 family GTP cyclohydrolase 1 type 2